ncbi:MAG: hypothetical protein KGI67_00725 [Pseudomonadota bacterium]|nr:hypothetical protein [Pseudomonadota bacterium]
MLLAFGLVAGCMLLLSVAPRRGATLTIAWDADQRQPQVAGYKVYYGTRSHVYDDFQDAGKAHNCRIGALADRTTYYVAVASYDLTGTESTLSREVAGMARSEWPALALRGAGDRRGCDGGRAAPLPFESAIQFLMSRFRVRLAALFASIPWPVADRGGRLSPNGDGKSPL